MVVWVDIIPGKWPFPFLPTMPNKSWGEGGIRICFNACAKVEDSVQGQTSWHDGSYKVPWKSEWQNIRGKVFSPYPLLPYHLKVTINYFLAKPATKSGIVFQCNQACVFTIFSFKRQLLCNVNKSIILYLCFNYELLGWNQTSIDKNPSLLGELSKEMITKPRINLAWPNTC